MIDFAKLRESISSLVKENASKDELQTLASTLGEVDKAEKEYNEVVSDSNEIRKMYIEACKTMGSKDTAKQDEEEKEVSLEDMLNQKALEERQKR